MKATSTPKRWTEAETLALVQLYNHMLERQIAGTLGAGNGKRSKAALVREFIELHAPGRTRGSVEAKLMNVSHARKLAGLPLVTGYKPLCNASTDLVKLFNGGKG